MVRSIMPRLTPVTRHVARALVGLSLAGAEVTTWRLPVAGEDNRRVRPRRYDEPLAV
jgi:hypothetical protein